MIFTDNKLRFPDNGFYYTIALIPTVGALPVACPLRGRDVSEKRTYRLPDTSRHQRGPGVSIIAVVYHFHRNKHAIFYGPHIFSSTVQDKNSGIITDNT